MNSRSRRFTHDTEDGLIASEATRLGRGKWFAHHWGPQLDGGTTTPTLREANAYLTESFQQMFPEHQCTKQCHRDPINPDTRPSLPFRPC
jgi:hypothetical protein